MRTCGPTICRGEERVIKKVTSISGNWCVTHYLRRVDLIFVCFRAF